MSMPVLARAHAFALVAAAILFLPLPARATAPVTISVTASGQFAGQPFTLTGRATDADGDLSSLNFYINGPNLPGWNYVGSAVLSGPDSTASLSYTPPVAGAYAVHVRAFDQTGAVDSNANVLAGFSVVNNTPPTTISVTPSGQYIGQPVTFTGRATDPDANLTSMNFYLNGPNLPSWNYIGTATVSGADATASFSYTLNTPGAYAVHIRAFDSAGAVDSNANVLAGFTLADPPPTTVSATASGQFVGQPIVLTGRATDPNGNLASMDFYLNGPNLPGWNYIGSAGLAGADGTAAVSHTFDVPGTYAVHVRAHDAAGNVDGNANVVTSFAVKARAHILVDVNQLNACEAGFAATFAADGVWTIPYNSPDMSTASWTSTLGALNAGSMTITEDIQEPTNVENHFKSVDTVAAMLGRIPDAVMIYHETNPPFDFQAMPTLSYDEISAEAAHVVQGYGPIGARVVVLTRMYALNYPPRDWVNAALLNPNTYGVVFESTPDTSNWAFLDMAGGLRACLSAGRKCFMLLPPPDAAPGVDYLAMFQDTMKFFEQNKLLDNPNLYLVPAAYRRELTGIGFVPGQCGNSGRSVSDVVHWLQSYVNGTAQ
jgi:hypothetical protein